MLNIQNKILSDNSIIAWKERRASFDRRLIEIATIFHNRRRSNYKAILGTTVYCNNIDKYKCATVSFKTQLEDGTIMFDSVTFLAEYYCLNDNDIMEIDDSNIIYREWRNR